MDPTEKNLGIVWAQYGPYHFARAAALAKAAAPRKVHAIEIASQTRDYEWTRSTHDLELTTLCAGAAVEELSFGTVFQQARRHFLKLRIGVCLLPGYSPVQSFAVLLAAKSLGIRTVMMNESHAGTARAALPLSWVKRGLVSLFDSALVGGRPQQRYFAALGMAEDEIFTGYDAVDNGYFAQQAETVRVDAAACRRTHQLPPRYFLSLGRFVPKKNLPALIHAYRLFLNANPQSETHLVMVGAGPEDFQLRAQCVKLGLQVHEKSHIPERAPASGKWEQQRGSKPGVHFYGFRQIEENPLFYALAEAFILPSLYEEWGLVVNEAMASGLPVIVSERAGCAEDLLEKGFPENATFTSISVRRAGLRSKIRRNGFVFDPHSPEELSRVLGLLSSVAELRIAMGRASRVIVEKFSCENFGRNAWLAAQAAIEKQRSPAPAPARGELMIPPA